MFDLVIFDCDGVLVDSEAISDLIVSRLVKQIGLEMSPSEIQAHTQGLSDRDMWKLFGRMSGEPIASVIKAGFRSEQLAALRTDAVAIHGVEEVLRRLRSHGVPICVASSGTKAKMRVTLRATKLDRYFSGNVFSAGQVRRGKPEPDLFLFAADRMGIQPNRCAVVEDSVNGVRAGIAAQMRTFAFSRETASQELAAMGGVPFSRMEELPELLGV